MAVTDPVVAALWRAGCVDAEDEARLLTASASTPVHLDALLARRLGGEPLEHVLGWAMFDGLRVQVEPGVFVPRRRSELLVRTAAELIGGVTRARVVDLCCGSGAVGVALAARRPSIELHAVDVDAAAVRCARGNLDRLGGRVHQGDLYEPLPRGLLSQVDLVVANAPYVPSTEIRLMPAEARDHEPRVALDGGADGLDVLRRVVAEAGPWLAPRGHVMVESSERQAVLLLQAMRSAGLSGRVVRAEDVDATVVVGRAVT